MTSSDANPAGKSPPGNEEPAGSHPPPGNLAEVVTGTQHERITAILDVPTGLPPGTHIRTTGDVRPYAVAALGSSAAQALIATINSSTLLGEERWLSVPIVISPRRNAPECPK
jgi:hypothetical protein